VVLADRPRLSWEEICRRFQHRWVVLVDFEGVERDPRFAFRSAVVLAHSQGRHDALDACDPFAAGYHEFANWFTGPLAGAPPPGEERAA